MKKWLWQIYGFLLTMVTFVSVGDLFSKDSPLMTYYTILIAFDSHYSILLTINIFTVLLGLFGPIVVFLYACDIETSLPFWRTLFWGRILFDVIGHNYDGQFIRSAFYQNFSYGLASITILILPFIPSYIAHYLYAFKKQPTAEERHE